MKYAKPFEAFANKIELPKTISEKKSDGTISDDEEAREEDLMANVEVAIDVFGLLTKTIPKFL